MRRKGGGKEKEREKRRRRVKKRRSNCKMRGLLLLNYYWKQGTTDSITFFILSLSMLSFPLCLSVSITRKMEEWKMNEKSATNRKRKE